MSRSPRKAPSAAPAEPLARGAREHYDDAVYYDYTYRRRRDDVEYYRRVARQYGGPILELGVGTGRVGLALAHDGFDVVGLDANPAMLARCAERAQSIPPERMRLVEGDMRGFALGRRFPLIVSPFNALLHLYSPDDFTACFRAVRDHLAPEGRFVFDVRMPSPAELARDPHRVYKARPFVHPTLGVKVAYTERFAYDPIQQVQHVTMRFEPEGRTHAPLEVLLSQRQIFPVELRALLALGGLRMVRRHGDFTGRPLGPDDAQMILECVAAP